MNWPVADFDSTAQFPVRRPALPSQPPQGRAADNPLTHIDPAGLRCLLGMVFERRESAELLRVSTGCHDAMALRPGALITALGRVAQSEAQSGRLIAHAIDCRLFAATLPYVDMPLCALAMLWATHRSILPGQAVAAMLWLALRSRAPCRQHFAQRLMEDIGWLGAQAVGAR